MHTKTILFFTTLVFFQTKGYTQPSHSCYDTAGKTFKLILAPNGFYSFNENKVSETDGKRALIIATKVFNSEAFRDSICKYTFDCRNQDPLLQNCNNISANQVLQMLYTYGTRTLKLKIKRGGGRTFGESSKDNPLISSYYRTIENDAALPFIYKYAYHICHEYMHIIGYSHFQSAREREIYNDVAEATGWIAYNIISDWYYHHNWRYDTKEANNIKDLAGSANSQFNIVPPGITATIKVSGIPYYDIILLKRLLISATATKADSIHAILYYYFNNGKPPNNPPSDNLTLTQNNPFIYNAVYNWYNKVYQHGDSTPIKPVDVMHAQNDLTNNIPVELANPTSLLGSAEGMDVTNFADGLANFLVDRAKQELSMAFFDKFKTDLNDPKYSDLKILFPETFKTLNTIDKGIYQYSSYLNTLREAAIKDLGNMYVDFGDVIQQDKYQIYFNTHPDTKTVIYNALYFINQYTTKVHPGVALANYNPEKLIWLSDTIAQRNIRSSIELLQLFSQSMRSKSSNNYWLSSDSLQVLFHDTTIFDFYLSVIYQEGTGITFRNKTNTTKPITLRAVLNSLRSDSKKYRDSALKYLNFIERISNHAEEVNQYLTSIKNKKKNEIDYNDYYKLFNASIDIFQDGLSFVNLPYINKKLTQGSIDTLHYQANKWLYVTRATGELYVDVRTTNYSSAILNIVSITDTVLGQNDANYIPYINSKLLESKDNLMKKIGFLSFGERTSINSIIDKYAKNSRSIDINEFNNSINAIEFKKLPDSIKLCYSISKNVKELADSVLKYTLMKQNGVIHQNTSSALLKYGSFIAALASSNNPTDVENVLESAALPAGSYSIKRNSLFNFALNGYIGGEWDFNLKNTNVTNSYSLMLRNQYNLDLNVYAPVGLGVSIGSGIFPHCKNSGSLTAFFPLIDVGSIANFSISHNDSLLNQKVTLAGIFSPGVTLIYGIPTLPISISGGLVYKPELLYENQQDVLTTIPGTWRWNLSVLIDIPFINFVNTPR